MKFVLPSFVFAFLLCLCGCGENPSKEDSVPSPVIGEGWFDLEKNQVDSWRWVAGSSFISLEELRSATETYVLEFDVLSLNQRTLHLKVGNKPVAQFDLSANEWRKCVILLDEIEGDELLEFASQEIGVTPAGDSRELRFCIRNLRFETAAKVAPSFIRPSFGSGWHDSESDDSGQWRWSDRQGLISLVNDFPTAQSVRVAFKVRILSPRTVTVSFGGSEISKISLEKLGWHDFSTELELKPGENLLKLSSDVAGDAVPGDTRKLSFCISEFVVELQ